MIPFPSPVYPFLVMANLALSVLAVVGKFSGDLFPIRIDRSSKAYFPYTVHFLSKFDN